MSLRQCLRKTVYGKERFILIYILEFVKNPVMTGMWKSVSRDGEGKGQEKDTLFKDLHLVTLLPFSQ